MRQGEKRQARIVVSLVIVIILLLGFIAYVFVISPTMNGYVIKKQNQAVEQVLNIMLLQIQEQGYTQITNQVSGQSVILVPYVPPEGQAQQQAQPL